MQSDHTRPGSPLRHLHIFSESLIWHEGRGGLLNRGSLADASFMAAALWLSLQIATSPDLQVFTFCEPKTFSIKTITFLLSFLFEISSLKSIKEINVHHENQIQSPQAQ